MLDHGEKASDKDRNALVAPPMPLRNPYEPIQDTPKGDGGHPHPA